MERRILWIPLLAAAVLGQAPQQQQPSATAQPDPNAKPATLDGRVVNAISGEPLRKVSLSLRANGRGGGSGSAATTDADGRFRFENLAPGTYLLSGEKSGFVRQIYTTRRSANPFNGTPIVLASGQNASGIEFKLTPQGVITGRVTDEEGEPVARAAVQAIRVGAASQRNNFGGGGTNDVGEFRISNLTAGKYRIMVQRGGGFARGAIGQGPGARGPGGQGPAGRFAPAAQSETESYVTTYYPGVIDEGQAAVVEVAAGQEVGGINIRLQKSQVFRVRGRVAGLAPRAEGDRQPGPRLMLQPAGRRTGMRFGGGGGGVRPDGTFEIANVLPGSYELLLMQMGRGGGGVIGRSPVTVGQADAEDVTVQALGLVDVTGIVRVEGDEKYQASGSVRLVSTTGGPSGGFGGPGGPSGPGGLLGSTGAGAAATGNGRIETGNRFTLSGLGRDRFAAQLQPMPAGMYIKSVRVANQDVPDLAVDLTAAPGTVPVEIILSSKPAAVDGTVMDGDQPVDGAGILAVPDPLDPKMLLVRGKTASSGADGKFTLEGLAPGDYRVYALEEPVSLQNLDPDSLKAYESASVTVKLKETSREPAALNIARLK